MTTKELYRSVGVSGYEHLQCWRKGGSFWTSKPGNFPAPHKIRPRTTRVIGQLKSIHGHDDVIPVNHNTLQ